MISLKEVAAVQALIDALPNAEDITLADEEALEAAFEAYYALTDEQQALVDQKSVV